MVTDIHYETPRAFLHSMTSCPWPHSWGCINVRCRILPQNSGCACVVWWENSFIWLHSVNIMWMLIVYKHDSSCGRCHIKHSKCLSALQYYYIQFKYCPSVTHLGMCPPDQIRMHGYKISVTKNLNLLMLSYNTGM